MIQAYLNEETCTVHLSTECAGSVHDSGRIEDLDGKACRRCGAREVREEMMSDQVKEWAAKAEAQWKENHA